MPFPALQLERIRKHSGVTLEEIAERTKISTRFLRAIETQDYGKLPGGVFDINYIRQYAAAIRHPEHEVLEGYLQYQKEQQVLQQNVEEQIGAARSRRGSRWWSWLRNPSPATRS